jgi:hypothetical protein
MKKVLASSVVVLMVLFLSAGLGMARNGGGGPGGGGPGGAGGGIASGGGSCGSTGVSLVCDVTSSVPFTFSGTVSSVASIGSGLSVDEGEGAIVIIYGMGPYWFWDAAVPAIDRPDFGDVVSGNAMEVTFSDGTIKNIAMDITVGTQAELILRVPCGGDPDYPDLVGGVPYWSGGRGGQ